MGVLGGGIDDQRRAATRRQLLQTLLILREIAQNFQYCMVIDMNNGTAITVLRLLIDHHLVQCKGRKNKQPPRPHGVLPVINNGDTVAFLDIQHFKTLMPVMVTHRVRKQTTE
ncbi:MAG: hypothetical protein K0R86_1116 [Enterobacter kobei]|nr:hypothetical protein [Enterobacter kobei]